MRYAIMTASTTEYREKTEDSTATAIREILEQAGDTVVFQKVLPADRKVIGEIMKRITEKEAADVILAIGGTCLKKTDVTPDATADVIEIPLPGIPEALRAYLRKHTPHGMLSRAQAGICGGVLIVDLPEDRKLAQGCLGQLLPELAYVVEEARGESKGHDQI